MAMWLYYHTVLPLTRYLTLAWGDWADTASARTAPARSEGAKKGSREKACGHERQPLGEELSDPGRDTEMIVCREARIWPGEDS